MTDFNRRQMLLAAAASLGPLGAAAAAPAARSVAQLSQRLDALRPGDVLSDCYAAAGDGAAIVQRSGLLPAARAAWQRGVVFDLGRSGDFNLAVAEAAIQQGCPPHALSTNIAGLAGALSRLLAVGLPLAQSVKMAVALQVGTPADRMMFEWIAGPVNFVDAQDNRRRGPGLLRLVRTSRAQAPSGGVL